MRQESIAHVDGLFDDFFRFFDRQRFDVDAARFAGNQQRVARTWIHGDRYIEFVLNRDCLFNQERSDFDFVMKQTLRFALRIFEGPDKGNQTAFATSATQNL